jgi:hypothetical protein
MQTMILRRGLDRWYYFYAEITAKANGMTVIIDRRLRERRLGVLRTDLERRAIERRGVPPGTWASEGFMFISQ